MRIPVKVDPSSGENGLDVTSLNGVVGAERRWHILFLPVLIRILVLPHRFSFFSFHF
jgi:hypothetical protein